MIYSMKNFNYLRGFDSFANRFRLNEMASNLMSIPEFKKQPELMRFIHTLSSEYVARGSGKAGSRRGGKFRTQQLDSDKPGGYYGGDLPPHQDFRLSHDVMVRGEKTGKDRIYQWLDNLDKQKDTDPHAIIVSPDPVAPQIWYLTRKTGTLSPKERMARFGTEDRQPAWEAGISVKAGYFMRAITIDAETGEPTARWTSTLGQLMNHISDESVLYILEDERRAVEKAEKRKKEAEISKGKFLDYFKGEYMKILNNAWQKKSGNRASEFEQMKSQMSPEDFADPEKLKELQQKANEIGGAGFNLSDLSVYYNKWLEYMGEVGHYNQSSESHWDKKADLADVIKKHTMMGASNRFMQYIITGKVTGPHLNLLKDLGIDVDNIEYDDIDLSDLDI
jgi:hypothetical protein